MPRYTWPKISLFLLITSAIISVSAYNQSNQSGAGLRKKLTVGEIKEVSLPSSGDGSFELVGTSDNQEVVEVSRQQLAPAVDTLKRDNGGTTVFQIKGVTVGTANVVFSKKPLNQVSAGEVVRTYVVQVMAK